MPLRNACFVSYVHGQHELTRAFLTQLVEAVKAYVEPFTDLQVYVDHERLSPGYAFNEALAQAICESLCMIVIYSPRYESHDYCRREFAAMEQLEAERLALLGPEHRHLSFIIPIVFAGSVDGLPMMIRERRHCCDFSGFTLAGRRLSRNHKFLPGILRVRDCIRELQGAVFPHLSQWSMRRDCNVFRIPEVHQLQPWRRPGETGSPPFPLR